MTDKEKLLNRLSSANPGWREWQELMNLINSLEIEYVEDEDRGNYYISGRRLSFKELNEDEIEIPEWMPDYVKALYGMKADDYECAGGYAEDFDGVESIPDSIFAVGGSDEMMGLPAIPVPENTFSFQSNFNGALFHINNELQVLCPDRNNECFTKFDSLEAFTKKNIQQVLENKLWYEVYEDILSPLID